MRDFTLAPTVISDLKKTLIKPPENYNLYPSLQDVRDFKSKYVVLDIETTYVTFEVTVVGISDGPYKAMCVPFKGPYKEEIKRILLNAEEIVGQNILQFDLPILCKALGIEYP